MKFFILFFLCGVLTSLVFPPFFYIPIGFISFPFLYYLLINREYNLLSNKKHFFSGFLFGLGFFIIYLGWIKEPFLLDLETKNISFLSYLLVIYCSFYFGFIFLILKYFENFLLKLIFLPSLIVIAEFICANLFYGFPWFSFSLVHSNNFFGITIIYFIGTYGLSYITIIFFLFPSIFFLQKNKYSKIFLFYIFTLFLMTFLLIFVRTFDQKEQPTNQKSVSIIQLNSPSNQYLNQDEKIAKMEKIIDLINKNESDIIIFGENDYPFLMNIEHINNIQKTIRNNKKVIIGATREEKNKYFNSLFLIDKSEFQKFDKEILVPFGEFIPFRLLFGFMDYIVGSTDFSKGTDKRILKFDEEINIIPIICYEILYFWKILNFDNKQSKIIVNLTNDSWFGDYSGPYQHFYFAKLRAAEFNKPLIRVSTNGISAFINNFGQIINSTKLNSKEIKNFKININKFQNNYLFIHKFITLLIFFNFFAGFIINKIYGKNKI